MREASDHVEVFQDVDGEYRWRRVAANHEIVSVSGEGFVKHAYALTSAQNYNQDVTDIRDSTTAPDPEDMADAVVVEVEEVDGDA